MELKGATCVPSLPPCGKEELHSARVFFRPFFTLLLRIEDRRVLFSLLFLQEKICMNITLSFPFLKGFRLSPLFLLFFFSSFSSVSRIGLRGFGPFPFFLSREGITKNIRDLSPVFLLFSEVSLPLPPPF